MAQDKEKTSTGSTLLSVAIVGGGILAVGTICWYAYKSIGQDNKSTNQVLEGKGEQPVGPIETKIPPQHADAESKDPDDTEISPTRQESISSMNEVEACGKETFLRVLRDIYNGMEKVVMDLDQLQEELKDQGHDDYKIEETLNDTYERAIDNIQKTSFAKHNTTEEAVEKAASVYENDPEVKNITQKMGKLSAALTGTSPDLDSSELERIPVNFTVDKLIELLTLMMDRMTESRREAVEEVQAELGSEQIPKTRVEERYAPKIEKFKQEIFDSYDGEMNEDILHLATQKYMQDTKLQKALQKLARKQEQEFRIIDSVIDPES